MDLSDLAIFKAVVEAGGITRAADRLHRVQSNVTTRIRQLEDDLGVPLFLRQGKRLQLAPAGQLLLGYADRLLALAEEARAAMTDTTPRGPFRLGAMESTAAVRLPAPLSLYHRRHPAVAIELRTGNPRQLAELVLSGALDAALAAEPIADGPFERIVVFDEPLVIVAAQGHKAIRSPLDPNPRTVLAFEPGCPHRQRLEDWFARGDAMPERIVEMSSYHTILGCAAAGMGISLVPKSVLATFPDRDRLSIHALPRGQDRAATVLFWRKGAGSPKIAALQEILQKAPRRRRATIGHVVR